MSQARIALLVLALLALLVVRVVWDEHRSSHVPQGTAVAPLNVILPVGISPGANYHGLYVGSSSEISCCWIASKAALTIEKTVAARNLVLVFWLPNQGSAGSWLKDHPTSITATIGRLRQYECCFGPGLNNASFSVPRDLATKIGDVTLSLEIQPGFVPHEIDSTNTDVRRLGVVLDRVFWL